MKNYEIKGNVVEITLDNGKIVKCSKVWVDKTIQALNTDIEDVLLMYLEDNDYLVNEEQDELDKQAKGKVKIIAESKPKPKTQKERVQKENPDKEYIVGCVAEYLEELNATNIIIENKAKLITFVYNGKEFKLDLVEKRKPKAK